MARLATALQPPTTLHASTNLQLRRGPVSYSMSDEAQPKRPRIGHRPGNMRDTTRWLINGFEKFAAVFVGADEGLATSAQFPNRPAPAFNG